MRNFEITKDKKIFSDLFSEKFKMSEERIQWYLNWISTSSDVFFHPVLIINGELRSFGRIELQKESNTLYMFHISCFDEKTENEDRKLIFDYIIEKVKKEKLLTPEH